MFLPSNITLKLGDSGDFVTELQRRLCNVKCFSDDMITGFYDSNTVNGVIRFQSTNGLHADGVAGPETLRRLSGVISGSGSTGADHKAEEEAKRQQQEQTALLEKQLYEQKLREQLQAQLQAAVITAPKIEAPTIQAPEPAPTTVAAAQPTPPPIPQPPPPPALSLSDMMMQMGQAAAAPQAHAHMAHSPQPQQAAAQAQLTPEVLAATANKPTQELQSQQLTTAEPQTQQQQPKSMVGRAMQYANEMIQKLATYFESKLPAHVLQEVKEAGHVMAKSGMKEAPIPTGPEQQRAVDTPARGPQQQQAQIPQRG